MFVVLVDPSNTSFTKNEDEILERVVHLSRGGGPKSSTKWTTAYTKFLFWAKANILFSKNSVIVYNRTQQQLKDRYKRMKK